MKIVAILQARCNSTRLPNKVLKEILGKPMLQCQIERLSKSKLISELVVATSDEASDIPLINLCKKIEVNFFSGSLDNVLDRFYQAAVFFKADIIVRLTGDCPLADSELIDSIIQMHINEGNDYTSNVEPETFPDGLDVEVMSFSTLKEAWLNAKTNTELEHVTPYIRNNSVFKKGSYESEIDYSQYRWTVDEPADFRFVTEIYNLLGKEGRYFDTQDILQLLKETPSLLEINSNIMRNEGLLKSVVQDKLEGK